MKNSKLFNRKLFKKIKQNCYLKSNSNFSDLKEKVDLIENDRVPLFYYLRKLHKTNFLLYGIIFFLILTITINGILILSLKESAAQNKSFDSSSMQEYFTEYFYLDNNFIKKITINDNLLENENQEVVINKINSFNFNHLVTISKADISKFITIEIEYFNTHFDIITIYINDIVSINKDNKIYYFKILNSYPEFYNILNID